MSLRVNGVRQSFGTLSIMPKPTLWRKGRLSGIVSGRLSIPTASNPEILGSDKLSPGPTGVIFIPAGKCPRGTRLEDRRSRVHQSSMVRATA